MLYVFVDEKQEDVFYATYNKEDADRYAKYKTIELKARYWDEVEIYEVVLE